MTKSDMAKNRWNQGLNSVVQLQGLAVDLYSCLSHTPNPIFQEVFEIYPIYDFLLPSLLPPQTLPPHLMLELLHLSLPLFTFPVFAYCLPSWLP